MNFIKYKFLTRCRADHWSRGVLPSMVCLSEIVKLRLQRGPGPRGAVTPWKKNILSYI